MVPETVEAYIHAHHLCGENAFEQEAKERRRWPALGCVDSIAGWRGPMTVAAGMMARKVLKQTHTTPMEAISPPFLPKAVSGLGAWRRQYVHQEHSKYTADRTPFLSRRLIWTRTDISAVSVPRDTRCEIPGKGTVIKVNAAYALGGMELSRTTIKQLLGVSIDYYMKTNIDGLKRTVDILGGVEIDIEKNMHYPGSTRRPFHQSEEGLSTFGRR